MNQCCIEAWREITGASFVLYIRAVCERQRRRRTAVWRVRCGSSPSVSLDRFLTTTGDDRARQERTIGEFAADKGLRPLPDLPYPATLEERQRVDAFALVAFEGQALLVAPELAQPEVVVVEQPQARSAYW